MLTNILLFGFSQTFYYFLYIYLLNTVTCEKMKKRKIILAVTICTLVVIVAVAGFFYPIFDINPKVTAQPLAIDTNATAESVALLTNSMNRFSLEIYRQLAFEKNDNVFISPYSVFVALAMTYEGARGETAEEMYNVLNFPQNNDTSLCSFGKIYNLLNQKKEYTLSTANALWIQENYPFLNEYLNFIENYYIGKATEVDFSNVDAAALLINQWVEEITNGKIKDFLKGSDIHPLTALILTNAIYFKGDWKIQFDPEITTEKDFEISKEDVIKVSMMSHSVPETEFNYTETEELQILEMPYKGDKISMVIILPKENDIASVDKIISLENISKWIDNFSLTTVQVEFPKFTFETKYLLKENLMNMGMKLPFDPSADFSGMTGNKNLYIDKVIHQAVIEVNEEGTEAAAATSVHMIETAQPQVVEFTADHPFIFLIQHKETGNLLFMGRLINP